MQTTTTELRLKLEVFRTGLAIVLGLIVANASSLPLNAQTRTLNDTMFQNIEAGEDGWNFNSEEETKSMQDNLKELEDYSILDSNSDSDIRLVEEDRRWREEGERPNYPDYLLETDIYDY